MVFPLYWTGRQNISQNTTGRNTVCALELVSNRSRCLHTRDTWAVAGRPLVKDTREDSYQGCDSQNSGTLNQQSTQPPNPTQLGRATVWHMRTFTVHSSTHFKRERVVEYQNKPKGHTLEIKDGPLRWQKVHLFKNHNITSSSPVSPCNSSHRQVGTNPRTSYGLSDYLWF